MEVLDRGDGVGLACEWRGGGGPAVVFLPGYRSDMAGTKALALDEWCARHGRAMLRLDYSGHGRSGGAFEDGTIGRWAADAEFLIRRFVQGPVVLAGSSMGGWIALLLAMRLPAVAGIVGIAPAPDFSEELIWDALSDAQKAEVMARGGVALPNPYGGPYMVHRGFIEDGRRHLLLRGPIAVSAPVRLLHGQADESVPWRTSLRIAELIETPDVRVTLIKDGDHRLSRPADIALLVGLFGENGF